MSVRLSVGALTWERFNLATWNFAHTLLGGGLRSSSLTSPLGHTPEGVWSKFEKRVMTTPITWGVNRRVFRIPLIWYRTLMTCDLSPWRKWRKMAKILFDGDWKTLTYTFKKHDHGPPRSHGHDARSCRKMAKIFYDGDWKTLTCTFKKHDSEPPRSHCHDARSCRKMSKNVENVS